MYRIECKKTDLSKQKMKQKKCSSKKFLLHHTFQLYREQNFHLNEIWGCSALSNSNATAIGSLWEKNKTKQKQKIKAYVRIPIKTQRTVVSDFSGFFAKVFPHLFCGCLQNGITFFLFDPYWDWNRQKLWFFRLCHVLLSLSVSHPFYPFVLKKLLFFLCKIVNLGRKQTNIFFKWKAWMF